MTAAHIPQQIDKKLVKHVNIFFFAFGRVHFLFIYIHVKKRKRTKKKGQNAQ